MPLKPPSFKVILELISLIFQVGVSFLVLCLFLPIIIVKIIIEETFDYLKTVIKILSKSSFIERLKNKK